MKLGFRAQHSDGAETSATPGTRTNGVTPASSAAMQIRLVVSSEKLECFMST